MKLNKNKGTEHKHFKGPKSAIVFYVLAVLFVVYGAYMIYTVYNYLISQYAGYNVSLWDDVANTIQYFVSNCSQYFIYAVLCYGIGMILQLLHGLKEELAAEKEVSDGAETEEILVEDSTIEYNSEEN